MRRRSVRGVLATLGFLMVAGCSWLDDDPQRDEQLAAARAELLAAGRAAFDSDELGIMEDTTCADGPPLVSARWPGDAEDASRIEERLAEAAEDRGWDVDVAEPHATATRLIDGTGYGLRVGPARREGEVSVVVQQLDDASC